MGPLGKNGIGGPYNMFLITNYTHFKKKIMSDFGGVKVEDPGIMRPQSKG